MKYLVHRIVYPDGETQDIQHSLKINELVDLNGIPLRLPIQTTKTIAYEVHRIQKKSTRNEDVTEYHLELCDKYELEQYVMTGFRKKSF